MCTIGKFLILYFYVLYALSLFSRRNSDTQWLCFTLQPFLLLLPLLRCQWITVHLLLYRFVRLFLSFVCLWPYPLVLASLNTKRSVRQLDCSLSLGPWLIRQDPSISLLSFKPFKDGTFETSFPVGSQSDTREKNVKEAWISMRDTSMTVCQTRSDSWRLRQCNITALWLTTWEHIFTAKCVRIFLVRSARLCHQRVFQMLIFHSTFGHFTHPNVKFPNVH